MLDLRQHLRYPRLVLRHRGSFAREEGEKEVTPDPEEDLVDLVCAGEVECFDRFFGGTGVGGAVGGAERGRGGSVWMGCYTYLYELVCIGTFAAVVGGGVIKFRRGKEGKKRAYPPRFSAMLSNTSATNKRHECANYNSISKECLHHSAYHAPQTRPETQTPNSKYHPTTQSNCPPPLQRAHPYSTFPSRAISSNLY